MVFKFLFLPCLGCVEVKYFIHWLHQASPHVASLMMSELCRLEFDFFIMPWPKFSGFGVLLV